MFCISHVRGVKSSSSGTENCSVYLFLSVQVFLFCLKVDMLNFADTD